MYSIEDIKKQRNFLENIVDQALNLARSSVDAVEVLVTKMTGLTVSTRQGDLENIEFNNYGRLNITVFHKKRKGSAFSNDLSINAISKTIDSAVNIAHYTFPDVCSGIADKDLLALYPMNLDLFHPISLDTKTGLNLASSAEKIALEYDKRIIHSEGSKFNSYFTTKVFGNSHGMLQSYDSSQYSLFCSVIAENNGLMEQNFSYTLSRVFENLHSSQWIGEECARKALEHLNSRKIRTVQCPVIFFSEVSASLFNHLASAINGNNVYRKSTFLLNYLKKKIFPDWLSIQEDPLILQGIGSAPFDSEGVQTFKRTIIENGVLNSWLLNTYSARKIGMKNTGHADGIYNWNVSYNKNLSFTELVKNMYCGVIITDIIGQGVNIVNGDYSRGISGFWVENGDIKYPISEVTVSGNLKQMFHDIDSISNDIDIRNNIRCGSILISSMKIAGI